MSFLSVEVEVVGISDGQTSYRLGCYHSCWLSNCYCRDVTWHCHMLLSPLSSWLHIICLLLLF